MSNAAITIQNETSSLRSIDAKFSEDRYLRVTLNPKGSVLGGDSFDVGDIASLDELNRSAEIQALYAAGSISFSVTAGSSDVPGCDSATAVPDSAGLGGAVWFVAASAPADGATHTLIASMPWAANVLDVMVNVDTLEAGATWTIDDGTSDLSDDLSVNAVGRVRDTGTNLSGVTPTVAAGDQIDLTKSAAVSATGTVMILFQRLS